MITRFATLSSRLAVMFAVLFALVACGGGGGGGGGFVPKDEAEERYYLSMVLLDLLGEPTNTVTSTKPARLEIRVTKKNKGGAPVPDVVVNATSDIVAISPDSSTGLTDEDGVATFKVETGGTLGAGSIVATAQNAPPGTESASINVQVVKADLRIGSFVGNDFNEGVIDIQPQDELSPGGTATLTVAVVNEFDNLAATDERVLFTSECIARKLANLSANPATVTGEATITYTAAGCEGEDAITATLVDTPSTATGTLSVAPLSSTAGKIVFVDADPGVIVVKGTGDGQQRQEQSEVVFKVTDLNDMPIPGVDVSFELSSTEGGLSLTSTTDVSDLNGEVQAEVNAGTLPTTFFLFATIDAAGVSTTSELLAVSTGVPVQSGVSLTVEGGNIIENGFNEEGVERLLTVRMRDKFRSPGLDGTTALFDAEYGEIDASCSLGVSNGARVGGTPATGECTVKWTSDGLPGLPSDPDLVKIVGDVACPSYTNGRGPCPDDLGAARGGRATITMTTPDGEEDFNDANGNFFYDRGEDFENLTEAKYDYNEDGGYTPVEGPQCANPPTSAQDCEGAGADEDYVDRNNNGLFDLNDDPAVYNGLLCRPQDDGNICSTELVSVSAHTVLILSDPSSWSFSLVDPTVKRKSNSTRWGERYVVYISDQYNNAPPAGSTVNVEAFGDCELESPANFNLPNQVEPGAATIDLETDGEGENSNVRVTLNAADGSTHQETYPCIVREPPDPNERL
jgi:hypothetical protein